MGACCREGVIHLWIYRSFPKIFYDNPLLYPPPSARPPRSHPVARDREPAGSRTRPVAGDSGVKWACTQNCYWRAPHCGNFFDDPPAISKLSLWLSGEISRDQNFEKKWIQEFHVSLPQPCLLRLFDRFVCFRTDHF